MAENNELREMIEQNIVPNGTKGITGQGLKNTLLEMADAIGKGGSSAGGAGVVFYVGSINMDTFEATQTPEQKAHNAEMFQIFVNSPMGVPVSINLNAALEAQFGVSDGGTYIATMTSAMYMERFRQHRDWKMRQRLVLSHTWILHRIFAVKM